ncbi:uncharacterized protein TM35_000901010 [Trypanosoma theileri]|uniref:Titin n=1 Tax=Trypanosoma theileri TaxID=67003 RepID=A0A1X0NEI2_9TRYP|nr:uncharacterized protein TM35_000901010 [Trypanosoma theileri]ORC82503.1 hypothetical protein TM35_000901010 [Trypanosoma theileri]
MRHVVCLLVLMLCYVGVCVLANQVQSGPTQLPVENPAALGVQDRTGVTHSVTGGTSPAAGFFPGVYPGTHDPHGKPDVNAIVKKLGLDGAVSIPADKNKGSHLNPADPEVLCPNPADKNAPVACAPGVPGKVAGGVKKTAGPTGKPQNALGHSDDQHALIEVGGVRGAGAEARSHTANHHTALVPDPDRATSLNLTLRSQLDAPPPAQKNTDEEGTGAALTRSDPHSTPSPEEASASCVRPGETVKPGEKRVRCAHGPGIVIVPKANESLNLTLKTEPDAGVGELTGVKEKPKVGAGLQPRFSGPEVPDANGFPGVPDAILNVGGAPSVAINRGPARPPRADVVVSESSEEVSAPTKTQPEENDNQAENIASPAQSAPTRNTPNTPTKVTPPAMPTILQPPMPAKSENKLPPKKRKADSSSSISSSVWVRVPLLIVAVLFSATVC